MNEVAEYYAHDRSEMVAFLPARMDRALEVGCGAAQFRAQLPPACEYWGIEPSAAAAAQAVARAHRVLVGTFEDVAAELPASYFDVVLCNDVIEHMVEPGTFLAGVRGHLAPGGVIVGSIPNVRFVVNLHELLFKRDWEYKDEGTLDRTHLRFFTERSLRRLFESAGYRIDRLEGINPIPIHPLLPKGIVKWGLVQLFGRDSAYLQFGFRITPA